MEPVAFDRNHYCIDATFYYRILADGVVGTNRPVTLCGLAVFTKRAVLCGEESRAHIFTSNTNLRGPDGFTAPSANLPTAVVEVTDTNLLGGGSVGWSRWDCKAKTDIFTLLQKKDVIV